MDLIESEQSENSANALSQLIPNVILAPDSLSGLDSQLTQDPTEITSKIPSFDVTMLSHGAVIILNSPDQHQVLFERNDDKKHGTFNCPYLSQNKIHSSFRLTWMYLFCRLRHGMTSEKFWSM